MTKVVAISLACLAFLPRVAHAAEPPSAPRSDVVPADVAPANDGGATWSPTATWRPVGPSHYDEDLALAEILNMSATVATKSSAAVSRSPGTVTVYGEQDIRRMGYYTVADLADVTAGYSSYSIYGERVLETRGQKAGGFVNNKHLVLIDGIPVNHGRGNIAMINENFPLFFANRVEFLKGPASALYGTGAFFGVVNIAPKELEERGFRAEWRAGLGSNQTEKRVAANGLYRDGVRHAAIYVGFYDKGPSEAFTGAIDNPNNRLWDDQRSEFLYMTYGVDAGLLAGLKAGFIYTSKNGGIGEFWLGGYSPSYGNLTWTQMIPYLKYERKLGRAFSVNAYVKASRDIEQGRASSVARAVSNGNGNLLLVYDLGVAVYEGLAELRWEPSDVVNVIAGVNVNVSYQRDGDGSHGGKIVGDPGPVFKSTPVLTSDNIFQTYSPFLQLSQTLPVLKGLHVTEGARLDTGRASDKNFTQLSPRVGLVQELTDALSLKVLYGTALRAPGVKELGGNVEALGDLSEKLQYSIVSQPLQPETIRSLEGAVALTTGHIGANVALFVNETRSALNQRPVEGSAGTGAVNAYANTKNKVVAKGAEVEVTVAATPDARLFANYAYAKAVLESTPLDASASIENRDARIGEARQLADVPIHKVNVGGSYRIAKPIDVMGSIVAKWVHGYRSALPMFVRDPLAPLTIPSTADPLRSSDHLVVDTNFVWRMTEHASLELLVRNVLNENYKLPQGGQPFLPLPKRSVHLTLDYRW